MTVKRSNVPPVAGLALFALAIASMPAVALLAAGNAFMTNWARTWRPRER